MYFGFEHRNQKNRDGEGLRKLTLSAVRPSIAQLAPLARSLEAEMLAVLPDVRTQAGWQDGRGSPSVEPTDSPMTFASSNPCYPLSKTVS